MKQRYWSALLIPLVLGVIWSLGLMVPGLNSFQFETPAIAQGAPSLTLEQAVPPVCAERPDRYGRQPSMQEFARQRAMMAASTVSLERFRRPQAIDPSRSSTWPSYTPREEIALIDPSNFGDRFLHDVDGKPATQIPIVVLHETVFSAISALNFFRTPHPNEDDQASYHTLIRRNGTITYLVPPDKRAYGAGNSVFLGAQGAEATRTKPNFPPSVNNFAYHVSLETPTDGNNNARQHSGYTAAQYQSLAWLVARTGVSDDRITTHQAVDRSGSRIDPRSFVRSQFLQLLSAYPRTTEIPIGCPGLIKPTLPTEPDPVLPPA